VELLLPYATLEPVRELLLQQFIGEKFGRDSIWETHLAEQLWNTDVELSVVLEEQIMRLSDVLSLRPGQQLMLNTAPGGVVSVRCGSVALFEGRMGQKNNNVAVKIERELARAPIPDRF
jgi:flagellar motor switch protein FliM